MAARKLPILLILLLVFRPSGLLGTRTREKV